MDGWMGGWVVVSWRDLSRVGSGRGANGELRVVASGCEWKRVVASGCERSRVEASGEGCNSRPAITAPSRQGIAASIPGKPYRSRVCRGRMLDSPPRQRLPFAAWM
jgi:hypothetical protein